MNELTNDEAAMFQDTDKFKKSLSKSNIVEISAGIFVILAFLWGVYLFKDAPILLPLGCGLIAAGGLYITVYIVKNRMRKGHIPAKEKALHYF